MIERQSCQANIKYLKVLWQLWLQGQNCQGLNESIWHGEQPQKYSILVLWRQVNLYQITNKPFADLYHFLFKQLLCNNNLCYYATWVLQLIYQADVYGEFQHHLSISKNMLDNCKCKALSIQNTHIPQEVRTNSRQLSCKLKLIRQQQQDYKNKIKEALAALHQRLSTIKLLAQNLESNMMSHVGLNNFSIKFSQLKNELMQLQKQDKEVDKAKMQPENDEDIQVYSNHLQPQIQLNIPNSIDRKITVVESELLSLQEKFHQSLEIVIEINKKTKNIKKISQILSKCPFFY